MRGILVGLAALISASTPAMAEDSAVQKAGIDATRAWSQCVTLAAASLVSSKETADVVADAALGSCGEQEEAMRRASWKVFASIDYKTADADTDANVAQMKNTLRGRVLSNVVRARMPGTQGTPPKGGTQQDALNWVPPSN